MLIDAFLGDIGVNESTIKQIRQLLSDNHDELAKTTMSEISRASFGGSSTGHQLGLDTSLAREHVITALQELAAGMKGFGVNLDLWHKDVEFTDEDAAARLTSIQSAANCTTPTDFTAGSGTGSCTVDGATGGDA